MKRIYSIINGIKRFRFAIVAVFAAVILLAGVGIFLTSGQISDGGYCPTTVMYGEELSYSASAGFSSVSYEYSEKDSNEWSTKKPTSIGEYKVRAVAYSLTGAKNCGKVYTFNIVKRAITITTATESWTYDGKVHSETNPESVENLVDGQILVANKFTTVKNVNDGEVENVVEYSILDNNHNDITDNYDITVNYGTISIDAREVIVETASANWKYDGKEHYNIANKGYAILSGHEIVVKTYAKITQRGKVKNEQTVIIKDADGEDCTSNYSISYKYGILTVK